MSRARHRASGGGVMPSTAPIEETCGEGTKSASRERKDGGAVKERKEGGAAVKERKAGGAVAGAKAALRMDRPGRKTGGRVGADKAPLSSAANASAPPLAQQH